MSKKLNIKTLLIIFGVLLVLVLVTTLSNKDKRDRNFKSEIVDIDTAKITALTVLPKSAEAGEIRIFKENGKWVVKNQDKKYNADQGKIKTMIADLVNLKPKNLAANSKDKWGEYEVADSNMVSRIKAEADGKVVADVIIGKFSYQQPRGQSQYQMYGGQQGTMTTYVRPADDKNVYAVDGFLAMSFSPDLSTYRNKTVVKTNTNDLSKISFNYPNNSFTLIKQNDKWMIDGLMADSVKVANYLKAINRTTSSNFVDDVTDAMIVPSHKIVIEGNNLLGSVELAAAPADSVNQYIVTSSQNQGTNFSGKESELFDKLFVNKSTFLQTDVLTQ